MKCSPDCKTCQETPNFCLSCHKNFFLYANKCVNDCPTIDGYKYTPDSQGICVIPGLICPFGYQVAPGGNGCDLKA